MDTCCLKWDQRIPNEPIFERNFLIQRPEVINHRYPQSTDPCICLDNQYLLLDQNIAQNSQKYWKHNLNGQMCQGVPTNSPGQIQKLQTSTPFEPMGQNCVNRVYARRQDVPCPQKFAYPPWISGTNINIDADSALRRLDCYNPKDCISPEVYRQLRTMDQLPKMRDFYEGTQLLTPDITPKVWNNNSRMQMIEPDNFDYTTYIKDCAIQKGVYCKLDARSKIASNMHLFPPNPPPMCAWWAPPLHVLGS